MKRLLILTAGCLGLLGSTAFAQVDAINDDFELDNPCLTGDWVCNGTTAYIAPEDPACDPANPNTGDICNLYDPGEGYVRITAPLANQAGNIFRAERLLYDNFRMSSVVELRDGSIGRPADGMTITIIGGASPPSTTGNGGGGMGAPFAGGNPQMTFAFDNWSCNVSDRGDDNHVGFAYRPNGFPVTDDVPYDVLQHVNYLLNNKEPPPAGPNRFLFQVQVKNGLVTCDLGNDDVGMPKTRLFTYRIPDYEPFEGYLGMTASTGDAWQNQIVHSVKIQDITGFCLLPPADVVRNITNTSRDDKLPVYNTGDRLKVEISISNIRGLLPEEDCQAPTELTVTETLPSTWAATNISPGGSFANGSVTWVLQGAQVRNQVLSYETVATTGDFQALFNGIVQETNIPEIDPFGITGDSSAVLDTPFTAGSGFITQWLLLGPFGHVGFDSPGEINLSRDYLTDGGSIDEFSVVPRDGDTVNTNFAVAASTDYQNATYATPTWQSHANLAEATLDLIDLNAIFASAGDTDPDNVMAYAVAYVNNLQGTAREVSLDVASDDSIAVSINRCEVFSHSIPRGSGVALEVQDSVLVTLQPGVNRVLVKVFEGGGGWNFRLRFSDQGLPLESADLGLSLDPGGFQLPAAEACPIPLISAPAQVGKAPFTVNLSGARSLSRAGRNITSYDWSFGDTLSGTGKDVSHTYQAPGNFTVELTVTDSGGQSSLGTLGIHVVSDGVVIQGDDLDTIVAQQAATFATTADGMKTFVNPPGDDIAMASPGDFAVEITSLPAGETEFPVAILLRNVGDHSTGATVAQRTTGISSNVGFHTFNNADAANQSGIFGNVYAKDNTGREDISANDPDGNPVLRVQDPTLAGAYSPFAWAQSSEAKLKLGTGVNLLRIDRRKPVTTPVAGGAADGGNQVAAIVIGGDSPGLSGRVISCPVQPTGLKATADSAFCQITVDWADNPGQVTAYNLYRATASAGPYEKIATPAESQYVDQGGATGLSANTTYYYKVSGQVGTCESLQTNQRNAKTGLNCIKPPEPPQAPRSLSATGGAKQISLSWLAPAGGSTPTGYRVLRSRSVDGPFLKVADVPAAPTSYTDTNLDENAGYCYVVQSTISSLVSPNSNVDCDQTTGGGGEQFRRADADGNGVVELTDAIYVLNNQFLGGPDPTCMDAADADDSGAYDLTDAIFSLQFQFLGGPNPPSPGPFNCGADTAADGFPACVYTCQ